MLVPIVDSIPLSGALERLDEADIEQGRDKGARASIPLHKRLDQRPPADGDAGDVDRKCWRFGGRSAEDETSATPVWSGVKSSSRLFQGAPSVDAIYPGRRSGARLPLGWHTATPLAWPSFSVSRREWPLLGWLTATPVERRQILLAPLSGRATCRCYLPRAALGGSLAPGWHTATPLAWRRPGPALSQPPFGGQRSPMVGIT